MGNQFAAALDTTEAAQQAYDDQLGFVDGRTPFAAETMPDRQVAVEVNAALIEEVASHTVNRAGLISIIDEHGAGKSHFRDLVYESLNERQERFLIEYIDDRYDIVMLDLPGSASNVAYNDLWAARNVLASVRPGPFEAEQAAQLRRGLISIQENRGIDIEGSVSATRSSTPRSAGPSSTSGRTPRSWRRPSRTTRCSTASGPWCRRCTATS